MSSKKEKITLKEEIKRALLKEISEGDFKHAETLPSEGDLCSKFQVSRSTIREALSALEKEGILIRRQGAPTRINRKTLGLGLNLNYIEDAYESLRSLGGISSFHLLKVAEVQGNAFPEVCQILKIPPSEKVLWVERLLKLNNSPIIFFKNFLPLSLVKRPFTDEDLETTLYNFLLEFCDEQVSFASTEIEAVLPTEEVGKALEVSKDTPLLFLKNIFFNEEGKPLFFGFEYLLQGVLRVTIHRRK